MTAKEKILEVFFTKPTTEFHLRGLAREAKISATATLKIAKTLQKEQLITKEERPPLTIYKARLEKEFIQQKRIWNLEQLYKSNIIPQLQESDPDAIILFGSFSYGEDWERSDIDIAIINPREEAPIIEDTQLHLPVQLLEITENSSAELQNNILNGITLYGRWFPIPLKDTKKSTT